jgi:hypothetical protein
VSDDAFYVKNLSNDTTRGLICNAEGRCGAWGKWFSDVCCAQGVAVKWFEIKPPAGYQGIQIQNLILGPARLGIQPGNNIDVYVSREVTYPAGIPAQNMATPGPPAANQPDNYGKWIGKCFFNHVLTYRDLNGNGTRDANEEIYDPSYGLGPYGQLIDWKKDPNISPTGIIGAFGSFLGDANPPNRFQLLRKPDSTFLEITPPANFYLPP